MSNTCGSCGGEFIQEDKKPQISIDDKELLNSIDLKKIDFSAVEDKPALKPKITINELVRI